jgi:DMSO/TMAO reductase YedYZ molybdopterin-dependent catalytic subunit
LTSKAAAPPPLLLLLNPPVLPSHLLHTLKREGGALLRLLLRWKAKWGLAQIIVTIQMMTKRGELVQAMIWNLGFIGGAGAATRVRRRRIQTKRKATESLVF